MYNCILYTSDRAQFIWFLHLFSRALSPSSPTNHHLEKIRKKTPTDSFFVLLRVCLCVCVLFSFSLCFSFQNVFSLSLSKADVVRAAF